MTQNNLLVIVSDEHQALAMGCASHPFVKTPHLDQLAARGMRFTNAYTPSPICVPARASFATGRYVNQTRLWDNAMPYTGHIPGWGHALQKSFIPVESIGKLHYRNEDDPVGFDAEHLPMMVADGVGMVWASIRKEDERIYGTQRMLGKTIGPGVSSYTEYDAAVTQRSLEWLQEAKAQSTSVPWCLYIGLVAPHFPLVVPQEFYDLYPLDSLPDVKLHPDSGYQQHPWIAKQNAFMDSESKFDSAEERLSAIASYYGLCTWLDSNVGKILEALDETGLTDSTTVVYTSDHGDNVGARGLWGKSNMYEEACAIPMIMAGPGVTPGHCDTPVSLLDLSVTITSHFNTSIADDNVHGAVRGQDLNTIATNTYNSERVVFSEYHAAGAVTGAFMIRKGQWKYIYYVDFEPELFDLDNDPEERVNLSAEPELATVRSALHEELLRICDPVATDAQAHADQATLIQSLGGRDKALALGAPGATPPPNVSA